MSNDGNNNSPPETQPPTADIIPFDLQRRLDLKRSPPMAVPPLPPGLKPPTGSWANQHYDRGGGSRNVSAYYATDGSLAIIERGGGGVLRLLPNLDQIEIFVDALFRHASPGAFVSMRSFEEGADEPPITLAAIRSGNLQFLMEQAGNYATVAAQHTRPVVFCPPLATFKDRKSAAEADIVEGLAISVECDVHAAAAIERLTTILGTPPTLDVISGGVWMNGGIPEDKRHAHWRLRVPARGQEALAKLKEARRLAALIAGSDTSNVPVCHPIRWAGSVHRKAAPRLCRIETSLPDVEVDLDDALARLRQAAPSASAQGPQKTNQQADGAEYEPIPPRVRAELIRNVLTGEKFHEPLTRLAMILLRSGMSDGAAVNHLRALLEASDAPRDARWQRKWKYCPRAVSSARAKIDAEIETKPQASPTTLADVVSAFDKWIALDNHAPIYATLGTIAANKLPGDPVWLGLIAPPSSAKTEILNSLLRLQHIVPAATLSPPALLSGTPKKQIEIGAQGGLLRQIGEFGILVLKDFGSILSMRPEAKTELLAALREIFDGSWTRPLGTGGGKTLKWKGKLGLIFGSTEVYDSHYSVIGSLGDRFLLLRLGGYAGNQQFDMALKHAGAKTTTMRTELAEAVAGLFIKDMPEPKALAEHEADWLREIVGLVVRLRGGVERDRYHRDIQAVHGAEGPGRLALTLERLLAGMDVIGVERAIALGVIRSVALASVPPIRRMAFEALPQDAFLPTRSVAMAIGLPTTTTRRALEELVAHKLAIRQRAPKKQPGEADQEHNPAYKGGDDLWQRIVALALLPPGKN
jgi:hypothetical protein